MSKLIISISLLLISCKANTGNLDRAFQGYTLKLLADTQYINCEQQNYINNQEFSDPTGDVRIGNLSSISSPLTFQDIIGGKISNGTNVLNLEINLLELPNSVNIGVSRKDSLNPELNYEFTFYLSQVIKIGISNYSNGEKKPTYWEDFSVNVIQNSTLVAACGKANREKNKLNFQCEKNLIPLLRELNDTSKFNIDVIHKDNEIVYKDCF